MVFETLLGPKIVFLLGMANILGILLIFFSCRCLIGNAFVQRMYQKDWYRKFYNAHCYYWWFFFISVVLHTVFAFLIFGNPF